MSVTCEDILSEAQCLATDAQSEIQYRNAVSRGYYGIYHRALSFIDTIREIPVSALGGGSSHKKLAECFSGQFIKDNDKKIIFKRIGILLRVLHNQRCEADYDMNTTIEKVTLDQFNIQKISILKLLDEVELSSDNK